MESCERPIINFLAIRLCMVFPTMNAYPTCNTYYIYPMYICTAMYMKAYDVLLFHLKSYCSPTKQLIVFKFKPILFVEFFQYLCKIRNE